MLLFINLCCCSIVCFVVLHEFIFCQCCCSLVCFVAVCLFMVLFISLVCCCSLVVVFLLFA